MKRKTRVMSSGGGSSVGPDIDQIEKLLKIMTEHNLEEFEYSRGGLRIRLTEAHENGRIRIASTILG